MSVMLPRHQNWYIQKDLRLVHTKFSSVIEVFITVCFWVYYSNKRRVMMRRLFEGGVYLYFSSKLRCLVGAAFNRVITVCSEIWNLPDILLETGIKYNTRWRQMWTLSLKIFRTQRKDMEWWILASLRRRVETLDRGLSWKILSVCLKVLCNINLKIYLCMLSSNSQKNYSWYVCRISQFEGNDRDINSTYERCEATSPSNYTRNAQVWQKFPVPDMSCWYRVVVFRCCEFCCLLLPYFLILGSVCPEETTTSQGK